MSANSGDLPFLPVDANPVRAARPVDPAPAFPLAPNPEQLAAQTSQLILHETARGLFNDAIIIADLHGRILSWSTNACSLFGFNAEEAYERNLYQFLSVRLTLEPAELMQTLEKGGYWIGETGFRKKDRTAFVGLCRWQIVHDKSQRESRVILSVAGTTLQKQILEASELLRQSEQRFDILFGQHPDGVFSVDTEQRLAALNPTLCALTGYSEAELMTLSFTVFMLPDNLESVREQFVAALQGKPQSSDLPCLRKDGSTFDAHITLLPHIVNHRIVGLLGIVRDISHRRENEKRIQYLATHDPLTGLPNRNMLEDRIQHAIEQARRLKTKVGVLFLDLNRFKLINDTLGHDKGDLLLCAIAERLRHAVRGVDTVSRLGGDEFVIVLEILHDAAELAAIADGILGTVCQPVQIDNHQLTVSTSIGGSIFPLHGEDKATLLKRADLAMYEAKGYGAGHFQIYSPEMDNKAAGRLLLEHGLRHALSQHQLVLHYQPRLDVANNRIVGMEALVRWEHPQKGMIFPISFITMAEEIGLIDSVGEWVLRTACRQLKQWQDDGLQAVKMAVNVSAIQLRSDRMCRMIQDILHETGLAPQCLELEITESSLMQNLDAALTTLRDIRDLGVTLSIDDFGTGYSSLSYLKQLPIDTIKIDKSFVRDIPQDGDDAAIVTATIAMAHRLNLKVVAEGVTSFDQMRFLEAHLCDEIQGYLLCQPLPALEAESFFKTSSLRGIRNSWVN